MKKKQLDFQNLIIKEESLIRFGMTLFVQVIMGNSYQKVVKLVKDT